MGVKAGTKTSSPLFNIVKNAVCSADVQELTVIEYLLLWNLLHFFPNFVKLNF